MKAFTLFSFFLLSFGLKSQYIVTSASNPVSGDVESYVNTFSSGLTSPATGTNKTWNYSSITLDNSSISSSTFVPISSVPNNILFTGATIGSTSGSNSYDVYKINASTREYLGSAAASSSNCTVFSNPMTLLTMPFTYGSSYFDTFGFNINNQASTGSLTIIGNGTGTLILPGITLNNVLKVSGTYNQIYTAPGATITAIGVQEFFYSSISKFPLFTISTSTNTQNSISTTYIDGNVNKLVALGVGINESKFENNFSIYPNPASNKEVSLSFFNYNESTVGITLLNTLGQVIKEYTFKDLNQGQNKVTLDLKTIPVGIYYLQIKTNDQESTKKLIIE